MSFTPQWACHAIWYQIFPERFCNGDGANDPTRESLEGSVHAGPAAVHWQVHPWTSAWYGEQSWEADTARPRWAQLIDRRYGGDIAGIISKLDYLQDLGINALYLNPVFDAPSHHKYDAALWHHIDPHFGPDPDGDRRLIAAEQPDDPVTWSWSSADRLMLELISRVHERGMRIIFDGVFNHVGVRHWAYRDVLRHGRASRFVDWFKISRWHDDMRFDAQGWRDHASLPELRQQDDNLAPGPRAHVAAVTRRWMAPDGDVLRGIDGWRLDVATWLPHGFWREWRALVKSINPQAYLVAEIINTVAANEPYLRGDEFDAVMNYNFAFACHEFFFSDQRRLSAAAFDAKLRELRQAYPHCVAPVMQNLFGSHDTARLATHALNRDRFNYRDFDASYYPRESRASHAHTHAPDAHARALQRLFVFFQMTYLGAPMVYYGDEAGMWGANDPCCRQPMWWPQLQFDAASAGDDAQHVGFDAELHGYYRRAITLRHALPVLRTGDVQTLLADDAKQFFVQLRSDGDASAMVAVNRSEHEQTVALRTAPGSRWRARWEGGQWEHDNQSGDLTLRLPGLSGMVLERQP